MFYLKKQPGAMTNVDLATDKLMKTIFDETVSTFQGIKSATAQTIQKAADEAKKQFDILVAHAESEFETTGASSDKESKKIITNLVKHYSQNLSEAEKEAINHLNDLWSNTKTNLNSALETAKSTLGKNMKELENMSKEIYKFMEKVLADCTKLVHEFAKAAYNRLSEASLQYLK